MSGPVILWVVVGAITLVLGLAGALTTIRHLKSLSASLRRFREEVQPLVDDIQHSSEQAQQRTEELARRRPG